jgi:alpha,alpha-trehalase
MIDKEREASRDVRQPHGHGLPRSVVHAALLGILVFAAWTQSQSQSRKSDRSVGGIITYIHNSWDSLTRSTNSCSAVSDTKVGSPSILYIPADIEWPKELDTLRAGCGVKIVRLPQVIQRLGESGVADIRPPGLLYLPNKYVVPGGRFNEMYGWDSYFIALGLLRDGRIDLARGMVDNFFFEIEHYGAVLNANRTYYLTRSQPPFLSSMVMAVHEAQKRAGQDDSAWMATAYDHIKRAHAMWTRAPHLAGGTGLSRYYDFGEGPAVESLLDEADTYRKSLAYFIVHPSVPAYALSDDDHSAGTVTGPAYAVKLCNAQDQSSCEPARNIQLTRDYYKGDRSMRESGFDISFRFGPYGVNTHHFAPVCLNSLLYRTESDLAEISRFLGKKLESAEWRTLADARKQSMQQYLWDERAGMFFDFNFEENRRSTYRYATTFYPLWAGLATEVQARAIMKNLGSFEQPGGLAMSVDETHMQWDYPYGWAPIQLLAVEGMRRYGYNAEADRISSEFLSMVFENFEHDGTIREKYNVVTRSSEIDVRAGYATNVIGFGWTNAVFVELLDSLPKDKAAQITAWPQHPLGK